ncbi:MAG: ABC transporter permease [Candidatus Eiseniibacteriota bacterium]
MRTFLIRRFLTLIPLLMGVTFVAFLLIYLAPGDFLSQMAENPTISAETIEAMREKFGLDQPWYVQYGLWLKNVFLHLDFGESFAFRQPVFDIIVPRMGNTLILAFAAAIVAWGLAIPLGIISAVRQYSWVDKSASFFSFLGLSIPEIFFALLMMYMAAKTGWFPVGGMRSIDFNDLSFGGKMLDLGHHLVLPALVLGMVPMAGRMRQMRANLLDVLRLDYVTTARAKGLDERTVVWKHAVRNALNPLITLFGFTLASLLSGSFIVEIVMTWPGLGSLTLEALLKQDLYLVMGSVVIAATMLTLGNLIADVMLVIADPRIKYD